LSPRPVTRPLPFVLPAVALEAKDGESLMLVAPSDHVIPDADGFRATVQAAAPAALDGQIVTFRHPPRPAETGTGWLEMTSKPSDDFCPRCPASVVVCRKTKCGRCRGLLKGGMHLWNAGIFLFSTATILKAFEQYAPETLSGVRDAFENAEADLGFTRLSAEPWSRLEDISIDYAVMERAPNLQSFPTAGRGQIWGTGKQCGARATQMRQVWSPADLQLL
jgi:mannose-1-phosphate guanylyltransferase/mannose-6-phosphate isomerase